MGHPGLRQKGDMGRMGSMGCTLRGMPESACTPVGMVGTASRSRQITGLHFMTNAQWGVPETRLEPCACLEGEGMIIRL